MGDTVLMCKNNYVYNIDTEEVINYHLLPGIMQRKACTTTFKIWLKSRYSSETNSLARQLKGITFGQGKRPTINKETRAFSLSDCYWLKNTDDTVYFEAISPYYTKFWGGHGEYDGTSIPTLYVGGFINKEWVSSGALNKYGKDTTIELDCIVLCKICGIQSENILPIIHNTEIIGVQVENITTPDLMLEQANQSGKLDVDDFDEYTIERLFGFQGIQMVVIDAIVGNGDRHAGNFGWLRDSNCGAYKCMAPLYDFDHALDSKAASDRLILDAMKVVKKNRLYVEEAIRISKLTLNSNINTIFNLRAKTILEILRR